MRPQNPPTDHLIKISVNDEPYAQWVVGHDSDFYPQTIYGPAATIDVRSVRTGSRLYERVTPRQYQSYARELQILVAVLEGKLGTAEEIITEEMMNYDEACHYSKAAIDLVSLTAIRMEQLRPSTWSQELRAE